VLIALIACLRIVGSWSDNVDACRDVRFGQGLDASAIKGNILGVFMKFIELDQCIRFHFACFVSGISIASWSIRRFPVMSGGG
jgi:hypothetical protein